jgi:polar amino acid transport system substrate-binding protein
MKPIYIIIIAVAVLIVACVCVIGGVLLYRTLSQPEATATVPAEVMVPPTVEAEADDSWERVQAAGKIVVGTSADYPPFESYSGENQIDGFDIALMGEIGRRLGVQVEFRDFAFDGLSGALQLNQIDAAIAAISITPEREGAVDFSNVYFVGEDGLLAQGDSSISIGSPSDLAGYKVGVQRSTVYENWLQTTLVDSGQMPAGNLLAYEKAEDAIRDLEAARVELVMLDAQPAEAAVAADGLRLVGRGLNQQRFAIALPKGAASLKAEIDRALTDLSNEGFVAQLAKQYLNMEPEHLLPTPTPTPAPAATSTPGPPPSCVDGMAFVKDLTQEGDMKPGTAFTKGWQVKNSGTCTWDTNYRLAFAAGNKMGGEPAPVTRQVAPGDTYDIQLKLAAPLKQGIHQGVWQMETGQAQAFGERLTPGINFTVDRDHIKHGECVRFSWKVDNVQAVYFYAEGQRWQDHGVAGEGSQQECPPVTTTYYLRVVRRDNSVDVRQITIYVEGATDAPYIKRFTVDPPNQITLGQCVNIRWNAEGDVDRVKITANGGTLWDDAPHKGSHDDCPNSIGSVAYAIEAVGPGGTSRQQQNVNVVGSATATPQPTSAPEEPVIYTFSVSPIQIASGECVDINWSAGGGASYVKLTRDGSVLAEHDPLTGHENDCLDYAGNYTYRLEAYSDAGQSVYQEQTVNVSEVAPSNPLANTRWTATVVNGAIVTGTISANFDAGSSLDGYGGCNSYSASYTVSGDSLSISRVSSGRTSCGPELDQQEADFLDALRSASGFYMEAGELYIDNGGGVIELIESGP